MKRSALLLAAAVAFAIGGCNAITSNPHHRIGSAPYTKGSGNTASVTRSLASFDSVSVETGLTAFVSHGTENSARVTADDNLTGLIKTDVTGTALRIWVDGSLETNNELRIDITSATAIRGISVTSGSSLDTEDLTASSLDVAVSSGASVRAGGHATTVKVSVSSGSSADLRNVEADTVTANLDSGSSARVHAKSSISGSCSTGSSLHVNGNPATRSVQTDTSSSVSYE